MLMVTTQPERERFMRWGHGVRVVFGAPVLVLSNGAHSSSMPSVSRFRFVRILAIRPYIVAIRPASLPFFLIIATRPRHCCSSTSLLFIRSHFQHIRVVLGGNRGVFRFSLLFYASLRFPLSLHLYHDIAHTSVRS
ncbi:hypothetical protein BKA93DRAFT_809553 [Sparassis latifolia]